jgi:hypothetical protein
MDPIPSELAVAFLGFLCSLTVSRKYSDLDIAQLEGGN